MTDNAKLLMVDICFEPCCICESKCSPRRPGNQSCSSLSFENLKVTACVSLAFWSQSFGRNQKVAEQNIKLTYGVTFISESFPLANQAPDAWKRLKI